MKSGSLNLLEPSGSVQCRTVTALPITCKISTADLKLIANLIVFPDTSLSMASCADWLDYRIRKLLDWSSDLLHACYQWRSD